MPSMKPTFWPLLAALTVTGCSGGGGSGPKPPGGASDAGAVAAASPCDRLRDRIAALYRAVPGADPATTADDVEVVMEDCRADPARFMPCIESAADAASLERDCLIPLDDEGTVEGRRFAPG